ncbi:nucleolar protein gar2-related [Striga asiatica]|uniref:Nucleolar protein gar2-related n=1 Tax=Striga asiatica TaxID=4170 RepID=A0A5A7NZJ4_STRAF|nr:nucleolar protein gar2-related [Striga asiatica]
MLLSVVVHVEMDGLQHNRRRSWICNINEFLFVHQTDALSDALLIGMYIMACYVPSLFGFSCVLSSYLLVYQYFSPFLLLLFLYLCWPIDLNVKKEGILRMKDKKSPNNKEKVRSARPDTRDRRPQEKNGGRNPKARQNNTKPPHEKVISNMLVNETKAAVDPPQVDKNTLIICVDDDTRIPKVDEKQGNEKSNENSSDMEIADESDAETANDSFSSLGDSQTGDDERPEKADPAVMLDNKDPSDGHTHAPRSKPENKSSNVQDKSSEELPKESTKAEITGISLLAPKISIDNLKNMKVHPKPISDLSEDANGRVIGEAPNGINSVCGNEDAVNTMQTDTPALDQKVEEMENRIKNLETELREVAALEISLYSVVPEHGSSAHKVHTPARRLSRLYIYACKYWSPDKRATVARNTVSGLVTVSKSCGNDVSRLTFWLSNTVVLREIISQAFGSSCQSSALTKIFESGGGETRSSQLKPKTSIGSRQSKKQSFFQFVDDWQETRTFTCALEKVESWIFSRIVESIWWQTLAPNMQSHAGNSMSKNCAEKLLGPPLGDQKQGNFSIDLWNNAFHDAIKRLCPVRAGGHECGCLPVLARKVCKFNNGITLCQACSMDVGSVMEQCIGRLDVAMFNAILRESAYEIPTDPVSDPILESKVLPIPAGDLSFGSGAQLKNAVGNWTRWLSDNLGMDSDEKNSLDDDQRISEEPKTFPLLNSLSDLLMLPKDMLMERTIRLEVCPLISLPLVKRILCNFSPDEFCPDPVPGAVLEAVNAECIMERRLSGDTPISFPFPAAPVVYTAPFPSDISEKVAEADENPRLSRNQSAVQRKGYTSDDELDELESCLSSVIDKPPQSPTAVVRGAKTAYGWANARYDLLREVWQTI